MLSLWGKTVLVTGGCGFIGHHLVSSLLREGARVRVLDDLSTGLLENLPQSPEVDFIRGSVVSTHDTSRAVDGVHFIFHLASVVGMRMVVERPHDTHAVSEIGTRNVLDCSSADVPVVLFSSSAVYGVAPRNPVSEDDIEGEDPCLGYDMGLRGYAAGKWKLETLGREAIADGRKVLILRPFNVAGVGQSGAYGMVLPRLVQKALKHKPLPVYDDGSQSRCFSEVLTFVDTLLRVARQPEQWASFGSCLNIGSEESTTILDLAKLVLDVTSSESEIEFKPFTEVYPDRKDVRKRIPDTARLRQLLGTVEWPSIRQIVESVVADERSRSKETVLLG